MSDLIDFVRARLAEDERAAVGTGASGHPAWHVVVTDEPSSPTPEQAAHITRHGPWKVLRRVKADRRIVRDCEERRSVQGLRLLRELASVYADHADYREEWRP